MSPNPADYIRPYGANPSYWQHRGKPVVLLGGSVEDNLFQIPDLEAHLDLLAACGGNYVRCTMSSRDPGNVWPFEKDPGTGLYDLNKPGAEYWRRFARFLELTSERGIIAQCEVWDRFDFARGPWQDNPYNPTYNVNYTGDESGLPESIDTHPAKRENGFFRSLPALENNELILEFQHAQVRTMLGLSLGFDNVLYCMDNETNESPQWGAYWSRFITDEAKQRGVEVHTTEMWDAHNVLDATHESTWKHPEIYSFCDISQNNHRPADEHWANMQAFRQNILDSGHVRPLNTVKIYGANTGRYGNSRDGQERFWRNIFGGLAGTRFHRPPSGLGLSERAQAHIRSMRMVLERIDAFRCQPRRDLLSDHSWNEAYCIADPGEDYAVFFTDGGCCYLDVSAVSGRIEVNWLDILANRWLPLERVPEGVGKLKLVTPRDDGYWAAVVKPV